MTVIAYLFRQLEEFKAGKKKIFEGLNQRQTPIIDALLQKLIKKIWVYYPEYQAGRISNDQMIKFLRKEIRILMIQLETARYFPPGAKENKARSFQIRIETLFNYAYPVFMNFENPQELNDIFNSAQYLANEKNLKVSVIFFNAARYNELLKKMYTDRVRLKEKLKNLFSLFSAEKILERNFGLKIYFTDADILDDWLDKKRSELNASNKQEHFKNLRLMIESVIDQKIQEICA